MVVMTMVLMMMMMRRMMMRDKKEGEEELVLQRMKDSTLRRMRCAKPAAQDICSSRGPQAA